MNGSQSPHSPHRRVICHRPALSVQRIFEAFIVFWPLATWAVFTYVGEKMAVAHGLLRRFDGAAGRLVAWAKSSTGSTGPTGRKRGIFWLMAMVPLCPHRPEGAPADLGSAAVRRRDRSPA